MIIERFQLLSMVEVTADDDEQVVECHSSLRILDGAGAIRTDVPLHYALHAAVDVIASLWDRADGPISKKEFITLIEEMLQESLDEIKVSSLQ